MERIIVVMIYSINYTCDFHLLTSNAQGLINHCAGCTMGGGPQSAAQKITTLFCRIKRNDD